MLLEVILARATPHMASQAKGYTPLYEVTTSIPILIQCARELGIEAFRGPFDAAKVVQKAERFLDPVSLGR